LRFLIDSLLTFIAQSRFSPYCLIQEVVTPALFIAASYKYMNYVPFNMKIRYSLHCLICTECHYYCTVYVRESLLAPGTHF
jgi:hypothetical protein